MQKILDKLPLIAKLMLPSLISLFFLFILGAVVFKSNFEQTGGVNKLVNNKFNAVIHTQELILSLEKTNFQAHQLMVWGYSKYPSNKIEQKSKDVISSINDSKKIFSQYIEENNIKDKEIISIFNNYSKSVIEAVDITSDDPYLASMVLMKTESLISKIQLFFEARQKNDIAFAYSFYNDFDKNINVMNLVISSIFLASLIGTALLTYIIVNFMKKTAYEIQKVALKLEGGDFSLEKNEFLKNTNDEFGAAYRSLINTINVLRETVYHVINKSESVNIAASEISSGNNDLSIKTEVHAAKLQEINSTLNGLTKSVEKITNEALQVNLSSKNMIESVENGAKTFSTAMNCMSSIENQSKKIQEITTLIDSISFQTNILALNAAIEAARAGEHGRGFSVVASEVRALAKQVENHSKSIKNLITTTTEKTKEGSIEMQKANTTVLDIKHNVINLNSAIKEIVDNTQKQCSEMQIVSNAVNYLDDSTQSTASLVEQTASAAESLHLQSSSLKKLTDKFKT